MDIQVFISNRSVFLDRRVCVLVSVPAAPRTGEFLYISREKQHALEALAEAVPGFRSSYADWIDPREPDRVSFEDAVRISAVAYAEGDPYVKVELGRDEGA